MSIQEFLKVFLTINYFVESQSNVPILIWHGMLANPHNDFDFMRHWIRNELGENITIKSIDITTNYLNEKESSIFIHPLQQIDKVCEKISRDESLKNGFHAIGLSQGGQFMQVFKI